MAIRSLRDLDVWCTSMALAREAYAATGVLQVATSPRDRSADASSECLDAFEYR